MTIDVEKLGSCWQLPIKNRLTDSQSENTCKPSAIIRGQISQNLGAASGRNSVFTAGNLPSMPHIHNLLPSSQVYTLEDVHHSNSQIYALSNTFNGSYDRLDEKWHATHDWVEGEYHIQFLLSYFVILFLYLGEGLNLDIS